MYRSSVPISPFRNACLVSEPQKEAPCLAQRAKMAPSSALMTGAYSSPALKWIPSFCWLPIAHKRTFLRFRFLSSPFTTLYSVRVVVPKILTPGTGQTSFRVPCSLKPCYSLSYASAHS